MIEATDRTAIRIEAVGPAHAAVLSALHGQCFARGWDAVSIGQFLAAPDCIGLVAMLPDKRLLGFLVVRSVAGEAEVLTLGVAPEYRRRGAGEALMRAAVAGLRARKIRRLVLEVGTGNAAARALYGKLGFECAGRRRGYYARPAGDGPEDALVLAAPLASL